MSELPALLAANARYAEAFASGDLPAPPRRHLAVLTCMDARVDPLRVLGLDLGDAHVIRNAGGRASDDAIRSLALGRALLGIATALVIHHTDCRLRGVDTAALRAALVEAGADVPPRHDFLPLPASIEEGVREDVARLRTTPLIPPGLAVHGLIYDVRTGRLAAVSA
ncbi:MAG TPA: carbonic anhydrase [Thermomicrobiales bacterium]|nr:carbonic anhydrase [Thermomicrobiales bacterium]